MIFKAYKNTSPTKYFNSLKIENAKMQLKNSNKSINEIAEDLNFLYLQIYKSQIRQLLLLSHFSRVRLCATP